MIQEQSWYVAIEGREEGPFSVAEVIDRIHQGQINGSSHVFTTGMSDWAPIPSRIEFSAALREKTTEPEDTALRQSKSMLAEFHMRRLIHQAQQDIIVPARKSILDAEKQADSARTAAGTAIEAANKTIAQPTAELEELMTKARGHLNKQNASTGEEPPPLVKAPPSGAQSTAQLLSNATSIIASIKERVQKIQKTSKPSNPLRPDSGGAGCLLLIAGVFAGYFGAELFSHGLGFLFGALAVYIPAMIWLHHQPVAKLEREYHAVSQDAQQARRLLHEYMAIIEANSQVQIAAARKNLKDLTAALEQSLRPQIANIKEAIASLSKDLQFAGAEWSANVWREWTPASSPALAARFGELTAETDDLARHFPSLDLQFAAPALVPFQDNKCLLFKATGSEKEPAVGAVQSLLARLLATLPPGKLRLIFIDPIALGNNVAAFMPLADYEESLITSRAWSEPQHIEQQLGNLTEHMETVIQKYLRTDFKTIHDYNEAAREVAEPYRFVVVFDFPVNFSETSARRLVSIARNGPRCGVYTFIVCDTTKPLPYGFTLAELEQSATVIARPEKTSGPRWIDKDYLPWALKLDAPAPQETLREVIRATGERSKGGMSVEVPYDKLLKLSDLGPATWWKADTTKSIRVPLGPTGARKVQFLTLGEGMGHHVLIVGRPGSGKSNLMHVIITTLALAYSPEEIRLYLIDFKKGVEFKSYADSKLPHAEAIAVESEREFGLSVIERIDTELKMRGDLFRGVGAANITEYREKTGRQIPRVLLLVDEFQEFFTQDDNVARQATLIFDRLVRQGRAFGLHILLGSQTLAGNYSLSRSTLDQMAVRIAMQCSEADSRLVLSDDNPAARLLSRPGEAIYNAASGLVEGNSLFQVARFSDEDREERLSLVSQIAQATGKPVPTPIIFEGNELAHFTDCRKFAELLTAGDWPKSKSVELWLGDPIAIRDPIAACLQRQSGRNLLIISRDEAEGVGMCVTSILSILAQQPPDTAQVFIADFSLADSEWAERAEEIEQFFPHKPKVLSRQRDVALALKTVADEVRRRLDAPPERSSIYLVLQGLHRIKLLRAEDELFSYDDESSTPSELFALVLREGPEVGVHVIAWCDTVTNAGRVADRRMMREFGLRVGGAMSGDDSSNFLDDAVASRIDKPHRVIFFDEERPGRLEKFRPYSMPPREWLEETGRRLCQRTGPA